MADVHIPIISLSQYLARNGSPDQARDDCRSVTRALQELGLVLVRDPRLPGELEAEFHDLMLRYFRQPEATKRRHQRPDNLHQLGWTPAGMEDPRRPDGRKDILARIPPADRPHDVVGPDPKERFMIPVGPRPAVTAYPEINRADGVVPDGFPEWETITRAWGESLLVTVFTVLEMAAVGWGADRELFVSRMCFGPHLLSPTGADLKMYGAPGTVLAGFHNDTGCLTAHGRSNWSGLFAWTRDFRRFPVRVPSGCLLMQAGRQLEILTGGRALRGFHEVVALDENMPRIVAEIGEGRTPWRVTSTLFTHVDSDAELCPVGPFATEEARKLYPPMQAGERLRTKLKARGLGA